MRRRRHRRGRLGQEVDPQLPVLRQIAQVRVAGQQPLETPAGRATQRAEGIFGRQSVTQLGIGVLHRSMQPLSWIRPRRIQLFTVPSGAPSAARHLGEGQALIVGQNHALARPLVKLVETGPQPPGIPAERRQIGRARRRVLPALHERVVQWRLAPAPPQQVEALVADDPGEPRHRRAATGVEAMGVAPDQKERILHDVLGQFATAEYTEREAE